MSRFTAPCRIQYDAAASHTLGADYWRVCEPFTYYLAPASDDGWVTVQAGFLTDGASVPRFLWGLVPPWGAYGQAAVLHDYLCEYLTVTLFGLPTAISRERCDSIFNDALGALNIPATLRNTLYDGVCLYRTVTGVNAPSSTTRKRALEAAWREAASSMAPD